MAQEFGATVIMPDRCNKETVSYATPNVTSFQGSFEKGGIVDAAIGLCMTEEERIAHKIRYFVFLNRHGPQFDYFQGKIGADEFSLTIDDKLDYVQIMEQYEKAQEEKRKGGFKGGGNRKYRPMIPKILQDTED